MEKTSTGTPVGVDDPYDHAGVCNHLTGGGNCRLAFERPEHDEGFAAVRRTEDFVCPVVADDSAFEWAGPAAPTSAPGRRIGSVSAVA